MDKFLGSIVGGRVEVAAVVPLELDSDDVADEQVLQDVNGHIFVDVEYVVRARRGDDHVVHFYPHPAAVRDVVQGETVDPPHEGEAVGPRDVDGLRVIQYTNLI